LKNNNNYNKKDVSSKKEKESSNRGAFLKSSMYAYRFLDNNDDINYNKMEDEKKTKKLHT